MDGFALAFTDGRAAAAPVLARAAAGFAGDDVSTEEVLRWGWLATAAAVMVWDYETCLAVATRGVELAREAGRAECAGGQRSTCWRRPPRWAGTSAGRDRWSLRPMRVTEATGTRVAPYGALVLAGFQGRRGGGLRA